MYEFEVFGSLLRTDATYNSPEFDNGFWMGGVLLFLNITAAAGTTKTLDIKVQHKDYISGVWRDIASASFAQKTAAGDDDFILYPGVTVTSNRAVSTVLPKRWRVVAVVAGTV